MATDPRDQRPRIRPEVTAATSDHLGSSHPSAGPVSAPGREPTHLFNPGDTISGRYRIVSILGRGGMGEVYRADDLTLGASVALKFLPTDLAADPVRLDRFRGEVRLTRQISHANVCRVYDIVEADGRVFLTMEHIDGEDLSSLLRRIGRLPQDKAVEISRQICAGLQAAHDQGVIHRDLKPSNVMIDGRGRARIMDFGIAAIGEVRGASAIAGTPVYMAPEQLAGREATTKSDLYSLGLVLHEVFTGKRVHDVETLADLRELHQTASRPTSLSRWVSDLDPAIERAVMRCLESDPADRPSSAIAVAASLPGGDPLAAALAAGETPSPELVAAAGSRGGLRPPVAMALVGAIVGAAVALASMVHRTDMIAAVNPPMPRVVLEQKAREILAEFEGKQDHAAEASGWMLLSSVTTWLQGRDATPTRWAGLGDMWGGPVQFWLRAADSDLRGRSSSFDTEIDDPPRVGTGQRLVRLDPQGRLLWLEISSAGAHRPVAPAEATVDDATIDRVFALAGLDRGAFRPTETRALTRVEHDLALAWLGPYPGIEGEEVRASLAVRDGAVCWFRVEYPYEVATKAAGASTATPEWLEWVGVGITWMLIAGGGVIAWKNIRARRSDVRAGVRAALAILVLGALGSVVMRDRVPSVDRVFFGENPIISIGALNAGYFLLFYIALEPTARRVWPSLLVSWIRLTSGRWRDPMVGRDVLIGTAVGALMVVVTRVGMMAPAWFGAAPAPPTWFVPSALMGTNHVAGYTLIGLAVGIINAAVLTLMLVLLRVVVRSKLAAVIVLSVVWVGLAAASMLQTHWSAAVIIGVVQAIQITLLLRFGFLAMALSTAMAFIGAIVPAGFASESWWAGTAAIPALTVAGLAAYGSLTAIGDRGAIGSTGRRAMP